MNIGDIIYVKKHHTALWQNRGSYEYHFAPGDMYEIGKLKGIGI